MDRISNPVFKQARISKDRNFDAGKTDYYLPYKKPFHFEQLLDFMRVRAITGIELISENEYARTFRISGSYGYFTVRNDEEKSALILRIHSSDIRCYMEIYDRVRIMFDLDRDFSRIRKMFLDDPVLKRGMFRGEVPRMPVAFNSFEFAVRAVLGQQISVKAATTLAGRIAAKTDIRTEEYFPSGLDFFFPDTEELKSADFSDVGITKTRYQTLQNMMDNILAGELLFSSNQTFDQFHKNFISIKGIGDWTVNYVAMRGLGMMDAFPVADLGILKALSTGKKPLSVKAIEKIAEKWKPYRSYAALCLWNLDKKEA
ncbi:MAG: hypothetical protein B6241_13770 [Spirochaetaceae bacterium 4572_59]|nr:MAG: hypothetical protein B6241_13770 [Spirochaetaceae bacterium 4572_59]